MSYSTNPISMYKNYNLPYSSGYFYSASHHANNQYLAGANGNGSSSGLNGVTGGLDDASAMPLYYPHHHGSFQQPSPDYSGHDSYPYATAAQNSPLLQNAMGQTQNGLHLNHHHHQPHHHSGSIENLSNVMQNVPPSPPITVNSGCSEMSSPGITNSGSSGGSGGGGMGNGDASPHMNSGNGNASRPKSPYEWMKKPSYQSQAQPGKRSSQ